jgi:hypothetical protein
MNPEDKFSDHNLLEAGLRKEATTHSPQYSALLHERVMQRIARDGAAQSAMPITALRDYNWRFLVGTAAAMLVLIPTGLWWSSSQMKPEHRPSPAVVVLPLPPFDTALASAFEPASDQLGQGRYAYLDQDAQRFTQFVADQFDVLPTSRQ